MKLYLVQHAQATSKDENPARPLTEKGKSDSARVAGFLKTRGVKPHAVWHSPKARAVETAGIFAKILSPEEGLLKKEGLLPNDPADKILAEVESSGKDIMIVGHMPFVDKIASLALIRAEFPEIVFFEMGGVVAMEKRIGEKWKLVFMLIPELVRGR